MRHRHEHPEATRAMRSWNFLFFLIYAVQKTSNHFEGISKYPVRKLLKESPDEGGFGLTPEKAGGFLADTALGWYIKALFGLVTDNLPLFGYRRKSWLIVSSVLCGAAWFWVALNGTTFQALLVGLMVVNVLIAFSDVVCDGLMVETAQRFERQYGLPAGTANRPFQAAQWSGAMFAVFVASISGGIIAQFFELKLAAVISGIAPLGLAIAVALIVREEKVSWDRAKARKGLAAVIVIGLVAYVILGLKDLGSDNPLKPFEPIISALIIIGCLLAFVRIPRSLIAPLVLVFCWQAAPFDSGAQYMYQYFTRHNTAFIEALANDGLVGQSLMKFVAWLGLGNGESMGGAEFVELFWGSILGTTSAFFAILGALFYRRHLQTIPFGSLFVWCILGQAFMVLLFLPFPLAGLTSPVWLMSSMAIEGFISMLVTLAVLGYAAKRTPDNNQASIFALFMGLYNLGQVMGREQVGGRIYVAFADRITTTVEGVETTVLNNPDNGLVAVIVLSLCYLIFIYMLVRFMLSRGHIVTHPEDAEETF